MSKENVITGVLPPDFDIEEVEDAIGDLLLYHEEIDKTARLINFKVPSSSSFCLSLDKLLSEKGNCIRFPQRFYLVEENFFFSTDTTPPNDGLIGQYFKAIEFIDVLKKVADLAIPESTPDRLIFLGTKKLYLTLQYSSESLRELVDLDEFVKNFITSDTHKNQKKEIIKSVLLEMAHGRNQISVRDLLDRFNDFKERVNNNYDLYLSEFSYEKVKAEIIEEKLEAITNLNKVFSDIQNQLLALPIALLLLRGQIEFSESITVKNLIVWFSFLIFSFFMLILVRNQWSTLQAVKNQIDQQKEQLRSKYQAIAARFETDFTEVNKRYCRQQLTLSIIGFIIIAVLIAVTIIMGWYSGIESAKDIVNWLIQKDKALPPF
jgi:hypothetical protein